MLEIITVCPYAPLMDMHKRDPKVCRAIGWGVCKRVMSSMLELITDVNDYIRMKVLGTCEFRIFCINMPNIVFRMNMLCH
ncbi:MAG: hypothetical protein AAF974_00565 [Cyanobacteria bacterium P01_E01_bin.34]